MILRDMAVLLVTNILMLKISNVRSSPSGHFRIIVNGQTLSHFDYDSIVNLYRAHMRERNLPLWPGWEEEFQDEMCRQNPQWKGVCVDANPPKEAKVSNADVRAFIESVGRMIENLGTGNESFVSNEEAVRRAEICVGCPKNSVTVNWCPNCPGSVVRAVKKFRDFFKGKSPDLTTPLDDKLLACEVCKCANATQIHLSTEILTHVKHQGDYPSHCWKICNSPNSPSP